MSVQEAKLEILVSTYNVNHISLQSKKKSNHQKVNKTKQIVIEPEDIL